MTEQDKSTLTFDADCSPIMERLHQLIALTNTAAEKTKELQAALNELHEFMKEIGTFEPDDFGVMATPEDNDE